VRFDPEGRAAQITVGPQEGASEALVQDAQQRLAQARIQPPVVDGQPRSLETGVGLRYVLRPRSDGGAQVRMQEMRVEPLVLKATRFRLPDDVRRSRLWEGEITAICTVGVQGRCTQVEVEALPGIPESLRRWARASLLEWEFKPQQVDGQPIEGRVEHTFRVRTGEGRPEDFRAPKFDRINRGRGLDGAASF
jgi:hypothetical protein